MRYRTVWSLSLWTFLAGTPLFAAQLLWPQNRQAYYSDEGIEVAVAGLNAGETATLEFRPQRATLGTVTATVKGDGSTVCAALPPGALAPGAYSVRLQGTEVSHLQVAAGVYSSTMLLSQTTAGKEGGANFSLTNAFRFGFDPATSAGRTAQSATIASFEQAVQADLPLLVYMYWTGFVTHKPWGSEKSWANADVQQTMRLFNLHTAQRLRRFGKLFHAVGPIDEPGLSWGKTPAGGMASGFPNWDEAPWYEARGWKYTSDIAAQSDSDWMKYLAIRSGIQKESYAQASRDWKSVWPAVTFAGDLYAAHCLMDGCDSLNQEANDVATTHVFFDFFGGPMAVTGQIYLEKSHDPLAKVAHAMNGQLAGVRGPQRPLYHELMNAMLAAGLSSNWWLNTGGMSADDLKAVNEPAARLGPLFLAMAPKHDVAILWSRRELSLRQKQMAKMESERKTGQQPQLLLPMPEGSDEKQGAIDANAYTVGGAYAGQVLGLHQTLRRAGYPAHILHEQRVAQGALKDYRTLLIVGQTHQFPADVQQAVERFVAAGGSVLVDKSTTIAIPGATMYEGQYSAEALLARTSLQAKALAAQARTARDASVYNTNLWENKVWEANVPLLKKAMATTASAPTMVSDATDLSVEKHSAGEGALVMVLNGHEEYPQIPDAQQYPRYNPAPCTVSYALPAIPPNSRVLKIDGLDWKKVSEVQSSDRPQKETFEAGEMKLYLVAPRLPAGIDLTAQQQGNRLQVSASLKGVRMPWPLQLSITSSAGEKLLDIARSFDAGGHYQETLPFGGNAAGTYEVRMSSVAGNLEAKTSVTMAPGEVQPRTVADAVRVFDQSTIQRFLADRPVLVVVAADAAQKPLAGKLASSLASCGLRVSVKEAGEALRKVAYPRIWNPFARYVAAQGEEKRPPNMVVKQEVLLGMDAAGNITSRTPAGKELPWLTPNTLVTVTGDGFCHYDNVDQEACYEAGVKLYVDERSQVTVVRGLEQMVQTTQGFRQRWQRPWSRLSSYNGGFQLPPQLPEAYTAPEHLILLGDATSGFAVAALQASELLPQAVDASYPGHGKALIQFAWSPFALDKNVIWVGASDAEGLRAGVEKLATLAATPQTKAER